jgi:hypothetical protein
MFKSSTKEVFRYGLCASNHGWGWTWGTQQQQHWWSNMHALKLFLEVWCAHLCRGSASDARSGNIVRLQCTTIQYWSCTDLNAHVLAHERGAAPPGSTDVHSS